MVDDQEEKGNPKLERVRDEMGSDCSYKLSMRVSSKIFIRLIGKTFSACVVLD